jgi:hypothetical protein
MPRKSDKAYRERREYQRQWERENYRKKHPLSLHYDSYYDFETHRELAIHSGINYAKEWYECHTMGLMPNGIYHSPDRTFGRK